MWSSRSLPIPNSRCVRSKWPNRWMVRQPETPDGGVDTACGCNSTLLCLWFLVGARVRSGLVTIARDSGFGMGVCRMSRPVSGVGMLAMWDAGLDTMRHVISVCEVPPGAGVLRLLVPGMVVGVFIEHLCLVKRVEVTHWVISAMGELFSEDEAVEFWPWIVQTTELPSWEECLWPAGTEMRHWAGGSWEFPNGPRVWCFWRWGRQPTFRGTRVMPGWGLWWSVVQYRRSTLKMKEYFPLHAFAMAGELVSYLSDQGGIQREREALGIPR